MVDVDKKNLSATYLLDSKSQKLVLLRIELRTFSESIQPCEREIITIRPQNYCNPSEIFWSINLVSLGEVQRAWGSCRVAGLNAFNSIPRGD